MISSIVWLLLLLVVDGRAFDLNTSPLVDTPQLLAHRFSYSGLPFNLVVQFGTPAERMELMTHYGNCSFVFQFGPNINQHNSLNRISQVGNASASVDFEGDWCISLIERDQVTFAFENRKTKSVFKCPTGTFDGTTGELDVSVHGDELPDKFSICENFYSNFCMLASTLSPWLIVVLVAAGLLSIGLIGLSVWCTLWMIKRKDETK